MITDGSSLTLVKNSVHHNLTDGRHCGFKKLTLLQPNLIQTDRVARMAFRNLKKGGGVMDRRNLLKNSFALGGLAGFGAGAGKTAAAQTLRVPLTDRPPALAPIRAHVDRIYDIKCCIRPFRRKAPTSASNRLAMPRWCTITDMLVKAGRCPGVLLDMQVQKAMSFSPKKVAVIGCGIIGLTSAITAQRAGAEVTIYTRELLQRTRSVRANGVWGESIGALASEAPANLGDIWEQMARISLKTYRFYTGLAGNPVAWCDHYDLSDLPFDATPPPPVPLPNGEPRPRLLPDADPTHRGSHA